MTRRVLASPALLAFGLAAWAYGVCQLRPSNIDSYGLLVSVDAWFLLGLVALLAGFVVELRRPEPRVWLLGLCLAGLIIAIHATVPIVYGGVPEYAWVYKHIGIAQALGRYGRVTDPSNIYQQWPALFAATAAISALGRIGPLSFAAWAPVAFELADALMLLGVFSVLVKERRVAFLAVLLFEFLISWVGQDYLSPQAFSYLLWLGIVLVLVRWLRPPAATVDPRGRLARLQAHLLTGRESPPHTVAAMRALAVAVVSVLFFVITAAHQLTPYLALAGIGVLTILDLVRPRWLLVLLAAIAGSYLAPRYSLIAQQFGGLFSSGNPLQNASGVGAYRAGAEATTAWIVRGLAACMWLLGLAAIVRQRRTLGRVALPAVLAFSPFVMLAVQRYGGEAIYRVYLFSAPWCALLIAWTLYELRSPLWRWLSVAIVCTVAMFAGLQGLYGPTRVYAFTPAELAASRWLYGHIPLGSVIVLPVENFPTLETANYNAYEVDVMPADPQVGGAWMDEANLSQVEHWIAGLGHRGAYVVVSRNMSAYVDYFGAPHGFTQFMRMIQTAPHWSVIYRNADATIYLLDLG